MAREIVAGWRAKMPDPKLSFEAVSHYSFSRASCYVLVTSRQYIPTDINWETRSLMEAQGGSGLAEVSTKHWAGHTPSQWGEVADPSYAGEPAKPEGFSEQEGTAYGLKRFDWAKKYIDLKMSEP